MHGDLKLYISTEHISAPKCGKMFISAEFDHRVLFRHQTSANTFSRTGFSVEQDQAILVPGCIVI